MKTRTARGLTAVVLAAALAMPGMALARGGDGPGRQPAGRLPIKDRACIADCREATSACLAEARAAAAACFEGCAELVEAAREACAADDAGTACREAAAAARECLARCRAELQPALRACIADGHDCARACPLIGEPPCLSGCRADHVDCTVEVRAAFSECRDGCADERERARMACADDPDGEACAAGKAAVRACLTPCYERAHAAHQTCREALREGVAACDDGGSE